MTIIRTDKVLKLKNIWGKEVDTSGKDVYTERKYEIKAKIKRLKKLIFGFTLIQAVEVKLLRFFYNILQNTS